ncbi:MAG: hypothetical protein PHE29_07520 [Tissierellia bacterium]|nr:hypothetical protein [Tissierellia bacterium]
MKKQTGKANGNNYREMFLNYLETKEVYQVEYYDGHRFCAHLFQYK